MTLDDAHCKHGKITRIDGDGDIHRRLVDMGLMGMSYTVVGRRGGAALVDLGDFSAVVRNGVAKYIGVSEK